MTPPPSITDILPTHTITVLWREFKISVTVRGDSSLLQHVGPRVATSYYYTQHTESAAATTRPRQNRDPAMSRLSSSLVGRTPIADKIKIFDASATVKPRPAHLPPPTTPTNKELCPLLL